MYCSFCGAAVQPNLNYCNRCGAKVSSAKVDGDNKSSAASPRDSLLNAISAIFIVGLGAIIGLMAVMKEVVGFSPNVILAITVFSLLLMLGIESVLIRLLLDRKRDAKGVDDTERLKAYTTKELESSHPGALPEPVSSVTEHTTRSFAPIYNERTSK
jgi:hypothetical protein